ncbi:hypothetical protein [Aquimarina aggregata]|uniref:hypothetical protein n=1 Tax=Aquimarina aggregata TaxID=1642818 RepID=UPI0024902E5C|nr:hypothetical protein [Aquimarina aggregata]
MISKLIIQLFLVVMLAHPIAKVTADTQVYICKGPKSKRYHYRKHCRGLKRCSTEISKISLEEAKNKNRTLCGYED